MNKKTMMDDFLDLLFTVVAGLFVLFFLGIFITGSIDDKNEQSIEYAHRTTLVSNYLLEKRAALEQGKPANLESMNEQINNLRSFGEVEALSATPPLLEVIGR